MTVGSDLQGYRSDNDSQAQLDRKLDRLWCDLDDSLKPLFYEKRFEIELIDAEV